MAENRTKKEIWDMVKFVLDTEDELEIASWTKALLDLKEVQNKLGAPASSLITIGDETFSTTKMAIYPDKICMSTNSHEKRLKENKIEPDVHIVGDVSIEACEAPLQVHGNVFCKNLKLKGDFSPEKFVNFGNVTIYCENFSCDDITVSGTINIHAKKMIASDLKANKMYVYGDIEKSTFVNADELTVQGDINSTFVNNKNEDKIQKEINKHFDPKKSLEDNPDGIY